MNTNKTMPYDDDEIREIDLVIKIATTHSTWWFRGHPETYRNPLTPKIFRDEYIPQNVVRPDTESSVIKEFKRVAPALTQNVPNQDDHCSWLFLMQHHGAPTRLLDWTENALVALYFAVRNFEDDKDGELLAMYPYSLNEKGYQRADIATQSNEILQYLAKEFGISEIPQYPLALYPTMYFSRMVNQLSTFTIHPSPSILRQKNTILDLLGDNKKNLVRYIIPYASKLKLINDLKTLGISRRTLFPDLDGLSQTIIENLKHTPSGYNSPNPPEF
jgi:hypothetical protein